MEEDSKFQAAIHAPKNKKGEHEAYMLEIMDDNCIRATLLLLKSSWKNHLAEFGRFNDIPIVLSMLKDFPEILHDFERNYNEENYLSEMLFAEEIINLGKDDVRSLALSIFYRIWEIATQFFHNPPYSFYESTKRFFTTKIHMLKNYENDEIVRRNVETETGFGKEERVWIRDNYWREVYISKLETYFWGQDKMWRLWSALDHKYFKNGMKVATTPPDYTGSHELVKFMSDAMLKAERGGGNENAS
jgi:hypothetical protein